MLDVIGEAEDGAVALTAIRKCQPDGGATRPESTRGSDGVEILDELSRESTPDPRP